MFRDNDFEIMYMNRRVAYFKDYAEQKPSLNPPFSSEHIPFQAVRRIADNVIAFRRLYQKEILAVENMCCGYEIPPENLLTNRLSPYRKDR